MSRRGWQHLFQAAAVSLLASLLAACSGQFWVNTLVPRWGYDRHSDIAYGNLPRQKLDIYTPDEPAAGHPVVVFFYGGGWQSGNKDGYRFVGQALASRGITAVLPDYRLYPAVRFPAFIEDGAAAVAWTRQHIGAYGGNACHLFVAGHSAGAHIAAMLATDGAYLAAAGASIHDLAGFIGLAGPYDFLPIKGPTLQKIFAPKSNWPNTQPINFVDGDEPPMLLLHGGADTTVRPENTINMAAKVNQSGGSAKVKIYPGVTHIMLIAPLAATLRFMGDELDQIADFVSLRVTDRSCSA
ncbi:alpha/beta hydrolase [Salinisphaera sp.]|uniref:alpha/beta hydrolase n=1 Tax=Salinisphaera sp. TaxID=1914330 RepID=UPI002D77C883|nr:alpha/beta hydrolase [Salinisphaera sp.]HET7314426.1 alpha/beta hydrolase [Salinisphaera sp.]